MQVRERTKIPVYRVQEILLRFDALRRTNVEDKRTGRQRPKSMMECYEDIGQEMDLKPDSVAHIIRRLQPTTDIGKMYLKAQALKMAHRIVRRGSVAEVIDVLSRPGIDVLQPSKRVEGNGGGGFFLSVTADSCGAVKVGVATGVGSPALPPAEDFNPFAPQLGEGEENGQNEGNAAADERVVNGRTQGAEARRARTWHDKNASTLTSPVLERARERLRLAREEAAEHQRRDGDAEHQGDGGIQGADGQVEGENA
jgi:hypothetical protein